MNYESVSAARARASVPKVYPDYPKYVGPKADILVHSAEEERAVLGISDSSTASDSQDEQEAEEISSPASAESQGDAPVNMLSAPVEAPKKRGGRPKGSKNKSHPPSE